MRKSVFAKRVHTPGFCDCELASEVENDRIAPQKVNGGGGGLCHVPFDQFDAGGRAVQAVGGAAMREGMETRAGLHQEQSPDQPPAVVIGLQRVAGQASVIAFAVVEQAAHGHGFDCVAGLDVDHEVSEQLAAFQRAAGDCLCRFDCLRVALILRRDHLLRAGRDPCGADALGLGLRRASGLGLDLCQSVAFRRGQVGQDGAGVDYLHVAVDDDGRAPSLFKARPASGPGCEIQARWLPDGGINNCALQKSPGLADLDVPVPCQPQARDQRGTGARNICCILRQNIQPLPFDPTQFRVVCPDAG
jgi:hypothetical protein